MFGISSDGTPHGLKYEFVDINNLKGKSSASYSDLEFLSLDMAKDFGVDSLTGEALAEFRKQLEDSSNYDWALNYLVRKMGFNPSIDSEFDQAIAIYNDKDLVTTKKRKIGEYICQMHKSIQGSEFDDCCSTANGKVFGIDFDEVYEQIK